ncbi:MAG: hypothetical protein WCX32_03050 [Clostridia bacterium]|jgi:hypothetical protein|nr:hypothetical protein [Clostridia bacterium]
MGLKDSISKLAKTAETKIVSGAKGVYGFAKNIYDKEKAKKEYLKLEKTKKDFLITEYNKEAKPFKIHYNNGAEKEVKCLYDLENKTLKVNHELDKSTISHFTDQKNQKYFIDNIDLNGDAFNCLFNEENLTLPLDKFTFTTKEPVATSLSTTINNVTNNTQVQNIKAKESIIGGTDNKLEIEKETKLGLHAHIHTDK